MKIELHIHYTGQCQEAFELYQSILGGELTLLTYGAAPGAHSTPPELLDKIVHGSLKLEYITIAGADLTADNFHKPQGFHLLLQLGHLEEAERIFAAFAAEGSITLPLQKTFWSECYGIVMDKFGISWEVNYTTDD